MRVPECQKIKKGGLDQYDPECFGRLIFAIIRKHVGLKGLMCAKNLTVMLSAVKIRCLSVDVHVACLNKSCSVNQSLGLCLVSSGSVSFLRTAGKAEYPTGLQGSLWQLLEQVSYKYDGLPDS